LYARNAGQPVTGKGNGSHVVNTMKNGFAIIKTFNFLLFQLFTTAFYQRLFELLFSRSEFIFWRRIVISLSSTQLNIYLVELTAKRWYVHLLGDLHEITDNYQALILHNFP
jgi:hypothetical protein